MIFDTHTHCHFSHDSTTHPQDMINSAIKMGLDYLAFCDHCDKDLTLVPEFSYISQIDLEARFKCINQLKKQHSHELQIGVGLECGYMQNADDMYSKILQQYPTDLIINSVHLIENEDCYFQSFFQSRSKQRAYSAYISTVRASLDCNYPYDIVGHFGYVSRKAKYPDNFFAYNEFKDQIDDVLQTIIAKGKALEINTHSHGTGGDFLPNIEILERYKQLGGELLSYGSDSHNTLRIGEKYYLVCDVIKQLGFRYIFKYLNHEPIAVKI